VFLTLLEARPDLHRGRSGAWTRDSFTSPSYSKTKVVVLSRGCARLYPNPAIWLSATELIREVEAEPSRRWLYSVFILSNTRY
jgi:hypothetical protein